MTAISHTGISHTGIRHTGIRRAGQRGGVPHPTGRAHHSLTRTATPPALPDH
jgi:hypothetical protein